MSFAFCRWQKANIQTDAAIGPELCVMKVKFAVLAVLIASSVCLTGCQDARQSRSVRANKALPARIQQKMAALDMPKNAPVLLRIFKEENTLEVWKQKRDGKYGLIEQYEICKWSGKLGPKYMEGDRQAPEGFYTVSPTQMNPYSSYYLSFNIGFPNAYDRANGRSGRHLMVHGACSSAGCYSMTDKNIAQIYAFGRDAFLGGQREFQVHAFPFRMSAQNMARYRKDPNYPFWAMLKQGYDIFETNRTLPKVDVCEGHYVFNRTGPFDRPVAAAAACPPAGMREAALRTAYTTAPSVNKAVFSVHGVVEAKVSAPSIAGVEEARLVADWSRWRAHGEKVSSRPPSLSQASAEPAGAPDIITPPAEIAHRPASANKAGCALLCSCG